jgi:tryptophan-rich sensory protein
MKKETKRTVLIFVIAIIIPLAIGGFSAFLTRDNMNIYEEINTPPLSPPGFLFPVVWTILYVLMGVSSAFIWLNRSEDKDTADKGLLYYAVSLFFNFVWSLLFFNLQAYGFAFFWLLGLWALIILMIVSFAKIDKPSAYLQIPYFLWVTFAAYLNFMVWRLNA